LALVPSIGRVSDKLAFDEICHAAAQVGLVSLLAQATDLVGESQVFDSIAIRPGSHNVSSRISVVVPSGDRQRYVKLGLEDPLQFIELVPYAQHFERFEIDDAARVTLVVIVLRYPIIE